MKSGGKRRTSSFQMSLRYSALEKVSAVPILFVVGDVGSVETEPKGFSTAISESNSIPVFDIDRCAWLVTSATVL